MSVCLYSGLGIASGIDCLHDAVVLLGSRLIK
jgi:hypothetical protein